MGGSVTTYDAGMAVPDWPTTNEYWWYPVKLWLAVWDVFLEHGHRLLGQLAGMVAILLAIVIWRQDRRKWMRWVAVGVVAGVIAQGTLGGLRVLADDRVLARIHGCIAPLYFALCAAVVTWTSRRWQRASVTSAPVAANVWLRRLAWLLPAAVYLEIVFGALLRRPSPSTTPGDVGPWIWMKVINAGLIVLLAAWLLAAIWRQRWGGSCTAAPGARVQLSPQRFLVRRGLWLAGLLIVQLVLAGATWVTNYGWPEWCTRWIWPLSYTVVAQGGLEVLATTAHAATGSLLLAVSLSLALWLRRDPPQRARRV